MRENADQNNSEFSHFLRRETFRENQYSGSLQYVLNFATKFYQDIACW